MNRRFENYFANMGNGVLRAFEKLKISLVEVNSSYIQMKLIVSI